MAYRIELGQDLDEGLYLEIAIRNRNSGALISGYNVEHQLAVYGWANDYGRCGEYGQVVASNANGLITSPVDGILCINVPTAALLFGGAPAWASPADPLLIPPSAPGAGPSPPYQGAPMSPPYAPFFGCDVRQSLKFKLLATPLVPQPPLVLNQGQFGADFDPADFAVQQVIPQPPVFAAAFTKTLATGTISFGGTMTPRFTFYGFPLYPNSPTANVLSCDVSAMKQQLAQLGLYDKVEAGLGPTTDPATISWNTGGSMSLGGPLANRISVVLGPAPGMPLDLTALMTAAAGTNT